MTENPYHPSALTPDQTNEVGVSSNQLLWRAYWLAPAVAPLSFVLLLLLVGVVATLFGVEVNPASFLVLPVVALTLGMLACYVVAGAIGMPIAFYLRNRNALNGYTIHGAAFCWAIFFSTACVVIPVWLSGEHWQQVPLAICYLACGVTPPVLLSATAFWLLACRSGRPNPDGGQSFG